MKPQLIQSLGGASFAAALAASIALHLSTLAALSYFNGVSRIGDGRLRGNARLVVAVLADFKRADGETPVIAVVEVAPISLPAPSLALDRRLVAPDQVDAERPHPAEAQVSSTGVNHGHVAIRSDRPRSDFGPELEGDTLREFPAEVQGGVEVPRNLTVAYPPEALAAGREATVLLWAVVDADGKIEATHFIDGAAGFSEAVESALSDARFIPAMDNFKPIRYFVTLAFEFRIDSSASNTDARADNATTSRSANLAPR